MAETQVNKALLRLYEDQCKAITIPEQHWAVIGPEKHWPFTGPGQHWAITDLEQIPLLVLNSTDLLFVLKCTGSSLVLNSTGPLLFLNSSGPCSEQHQAISSLTLGHYLCCTAQPLLVISSTRPWLVLPHYALLDPSNTELWVMGQYQWWPSAVHDW